MKLPLLKTKSVLSGIEILKTHILIQAPNYNYPNILIPFSPQVFLKIKILYLTINVQNNIIFNILKIKHTVKLWYLSLVVSILI